MPPVSRVLTRACWLPLLLLLLLLLAVSWSAVAAASLPQLRHQGRSFLLVGGGSWDHHTDQHRRFVHLAGGSAAKIGIVVAPAADPDDSVQYYSKIFKAAGAAQVVKIDVTVNNTAANKDSHVVALIHQQTGFFFSAGDQSRVVQAYFLAGHVASPALQALRERWGAGAVVGGTSAGTACQPAPVMVTGGASWDALRYGAKEHSSHRDDLTYNRFGGTGLFHGYALDTHFGDRGREGRMVRLLYDTRHLAHGTNYGLGLDEETAIEVTWAGTAQATAKVMGPGGVTLIEVSHAQSDKWEHYFNIRDVYVSYLTDGDAINLSSRKITFSSRKHPLKGHEKYDHALTTSDIFHGKARGPTKKTEFTRVAASLFDARLDRSSHGDSYERHPTFRVTMSKTGSHALGYVERRGDFHSDLHSYQNMYLEITGS